MSAQHRPWVLVGIDGSRDGLIALDWAVRHAADHRWTVRGVHVVDESRGVDSFLSATGQGDGTEILDNAADELARLGYDGAKLEVRHGNPAEVLLEVSRDASLLVIGRRGAGGFAELASAPPRRCVRLWPGRRWSSYRMAGSPTLRSRDVS